MLNSNGTCRKTQSRIILLLSKCEIVQKISINYVELQAIYIFLVDMGITWRLATPSAEQQKHDGMSYKWSNYAYMVSSVIIAGPSLHHVSECPIWISISFQRGSARYEKKLKSICSLSLDEAWQPVPQQQQQTKASQPDGKRLMTKAANLSFGKAIHIKS